MSSPPPSLGGQAPFPASGGGADTSNEEASPVRAAPAPAPEPEPAPKPANPATTPSVAAPGPTSAADDITTSAATWQPAAAEAKERDTSAPAMASSAMGAGTVRRAPGKTTSGLPLTAESPTWVDSGDKILRRDTNWAGRSAHEPADPSREMDGQPPMVSPHPAYSHWFDAHETTGSDGFRVRAQLNDASSLDMALLENMVSAVSRNHDPISDGLYRLMARGDEQLQRFVGRTESCGQWAALTEADHELMLADMLADSARRRPEDSLTDQQSQDAMLHFLGGFAERTCTAASAGAARR